MIRWCSYCYTYLGQAEPIADLHITHGICESCLEALHEPPAGQAAFFTGLLDLSKHLASFAQMPSARDADVASYCDKALALGLKPADILFSLLQPGLYSVGERFAARDISVAQEHALTDFCERVVAHLRPLARLAPPPAQAPADVMLVTVDGNAHTLGLHILEFLLASEGYRCLVITPGLPDAEVQALALQWRPRLIGLSLAQPAQLQSLQTLATWAEAQTPAPKLVVGGFAFLDEGLAVPAGVQVVSPLLGTRDMLQALREAGLPAPR